MEGRGENYTCPSLWDAPSRSWLDRTLARLHPGSLGPWQAWQAWRLSLILRATSAQFAGPSPALLFQIQALLASSLEDDDGRRQVQITRWLMGSNLVKP